MTVWRLLGLGTNWNRVDKMNERAYLNYVAALVSGVRVLRGLYLWYERTN